MQYIVLKYFNIFYNRQLIRGISDIVFEYIFYPADFAAIQFK